MCVPFLMTEEAAAQGREEKPESEGRKLGSRGKDHSLTTVGEGPAKHESIYPFEEGYPTTIEFARAVHVKSWEDPSLNGQDVCAPPIIYKRIVDLGEANAKRPLVFSIPKGVHAGVFIGIGGVLVGAIGGSIAAGFQSFDDPSLDPGFQRLANLSKLGNFIAGIFGLPLSILAIVVTGADLFTGNCLTSVCAIVEQRISVYQYLRMLILSWCTNLAGNLIIAGLAHAGNVVGPNGEAFFINLAKEKTNQGGADPSGFNAVITKAILANVLIALAIAWSLTASSFTSKFFATLLPTSAFVAMDLEHTVRRPFSSLFLARLH